MEDSGEIIKKVIKTFRELELGTKAANEKLRIFLRGLSGGEMIAKIKELNLSDRSLNFLCEGIALEHEDYEICTAVEAIKKERALNKASLHEPGPR